MVTRKKATGKKTGKLKLKKETLKDLGVSKARAVKGGMGRAKKTWVDLTF
jgi:hypothetical protein